MKVGTLGAGGKGELWSRKDCGATGRENGEE